MISQETKRRHQAKKIVMKLCPVCGKKNEEDYHGQTLFAILASVVCVIALVMAYSGRG